MENLYKYKEELFKTESEMFLKYPEIEPKGHERNIVKTIDPDTKEEIEKDVGNIFIYVDRSEELKQQLIEEFRQSIRNTRQKHIINYDVYVNRVVVGRAKVDPDIETWFDEIRNATNDEVIAFVKVQEGYEGKPEEHIPEPPQALLDIIQK